ncbi:MAG TPA: ISNCY family transposase, partial [Stellaceae bacterium]|nr:ISNCY family transposase [Stellaceae bacterium]
AMNRAAWLQDRRMQKFRDVLSRWERGNLSMLEAGELLGMSERQFRRYRDRYEEDGLGGLVDRRLGKPSPKRVPAADARLMLELYGSAYRGWNVKHFHEHLVRDHGFRWGYTWVKAQLHTAGLVERAQRRGAHRRKRERKPFEGMMLHQDGSRAAWLGGQAGLDLIVTMDDATSTIYSAFLIEEEGTASTFRAFLEVFSAHGLPSSIYTDRGSHYFVTPKADGPVDKSRLTQVGRALAHLGIEHIPAYSPEARGRSERMFGTLQDRLTKELALAGISDLATANRFISEIYLPQHNTRFAKPALLEESAFVAADPALLAETLCIEEERVVARDNTVAYGNRRLQLPASKARAHYVKARIKVRAYPDGTLAVFHGPRRVAHYTAQGAQIVAVPTTSSVTPCSPPSRPGLATKELAAPAQRRPALTASAPGVTEPRQVGMKKQPSDRTKKLTRKTSLQATTPAPA